MLLLSRNYVFRVDPSTRVYPITRDYSRSAERVRFNSDLPINLRLSRKKGITTSVR